MNTGPEANQSLEVLGASTGGVEKPRPPSALADASPIINIASERAPSPVGGGHELIDDVARAVVGGEPADAEEWETAREVARDALEAIAQSDRKYEAPTLTYLGRVPSITLHMVRSVHRLGQLSLRREPTDGSWEPVFQAMTDAGFKPGDVVQLTLLQRSR